MTRSWLGRQLDRIPYPDTVRVPSLHTLFDRWLEPVLCSGAIAYVGYIVLECIRW